MVPMLGEGSVSERLGERDGEAQFHSPICSTFETLVLRHKAGDCHGELDPSLLTTASYLQVNLRCSSCICRAHFSDLIVLHRVKKL